MLLGNLASPDDATIDPAGCLTLPWLSLDWVAVAGDRWLDPVELVGTGTAVEQRRGGGLPVAETSLRVPGGQLVQRAWCTHAAGVGVVVAEVENRSPDAVGIGLVAGGGAAPLSFDGERSTASTDGHLLLFGRRPARVAVGALDDVRATVVAGDAPEVGTPAGGGSVGCVFPLAHTARLRLLATVGPIPPGWSPPVDLDALPGPDDVARGWQAHLDAGVRLTAPDPVFADAVAAARSSLLIGHDRDRPLAVTARVGLALGLWGHGDAAATALADIVEHQRLDGGFGDRRDTATTASVLYALATWALTEQGRRLDATELEPLAGPVAKAAHRLARKHRSGQLPPWFATAQLAAALLLDRAGQPEAAELCRERIARAHPSAVLHEVDLPAPSLAEVGGPDASASARFLVEARRFLLDDTEPGVLRLLTRYPDAWLGRDLEVHGLPTSTGALSFAVRWHGARPALLWELDATGPATLVTGLDPSWSDERPAGEALLAPVEPAGGLPKVVAPLAAEGTPAADAGEAGESFA